MANAEAIPVIVHLATPRTVKRADRPSVLVIRPSFGFRPFVIRHYPNELSRSTFHPRCSRGCSPHHLSPHSPDVAGENSFQLAHVPRAHAAARHKEEPVGKYSSAHPAVRGVVFAGAGVLQAVHPQSICRTHGKRFRDTH